MNTTKTQFVKNDDNSISEVVDIHTVTPFDPASLDAKIADLNQKITNCDVAQTQAQVDCDNIVAGLSITVQTYRDQITAIQVQQAEIANL